MQQICNFAIIAHVDHGKSTLADRFLELTGTVSSKHEEQLLDKNPISRERGITIKLAPVRMKWELGHASYILNLIDTPGHVDFSYEVERTLACVEGVILLVDATQGIQAQTIAHTYKALEQNLTIIPVVNKIDSPLAKTEDTKQEIADFLGINKNTVFEISAKTGQGVAELLDAVVVGIPGPSVIDGENIEGKGETALIFDSYYDPYRGVIAFVRVFGGHLSAAMRVKLHATNTLFDIAEVGYFTPELVRSKELVTGEIGYVVTNLKDIHQVSVGDSISDPIEATPLPGYKKVNPVVFASIFPTDPNEFISLKSALEKLTLNDSALTYEGVYSAALGSGFRIGFLGVLHADIVRERLEREFDLSIVLTPPSVEFKKILSNTAHEKSGYEEPIAHITIVTPQEYVGSIMTLCEDARGVFITMDNKARTVVQYEIPLAEIVSNFFERLKNVSSGYASFDWSLTRYEPVDADKLTILLNGEPVEEFSEYAVSKRAQERGQVLTNRLKELIPRQQYEVRIQAHYKGKIIASSRIAPFRKDVTQKLYGGDRTRKDKLLKKQKAGKKLMKSVGRVEIPKEVFLKLFQEKN